MSKFLRDESRKSYVTRSADGATIDELKAGALQRIADATEKMARRHTDLIYESERHLRWYNEEHEQRRKAENSNRALKGVITKLRKRLEELEPEATT